MKKPENLLVRTLTSIAAFAYLFFALYQGGWFLYVSVAVMTLIGSLELTRTLRAGGVTLAMWPSMTYAALMVPTFHFLGSAGLMLLLATCACMALCALVLRGKAEGLDVFATALAIVYPTLPFSICFVYIERLQPAAFASLALLLAFMIAFGSDIAAFFAGHMFGKHKLAPYISPNKSVEGAVGGVIGGALIGVAAAFIFPAMGERLMLWEGLLLGTLGSVCSIMGDLAASAIKRFCNIKDFGNMFPGHGGLLDRVDGAAFSLVWVLGYFMLRGAFYA